MEEIRRITVSGQPGQMIGETLSQKYPTQKGASRGNQEAECLPNKFEALSSNSSTSKIRRDKLLVFLSV
jgi:hypothetical protein